MVLRTALEERAGYGRWKIMPREKWRSLVSISYKGSTPYPSLRSLEAERENLKMTHKADQTRVTRLGLENQPVLATGMLILGRSEHGYDESLID